MNVQVQQVRTDEFPTAEAQQCGQHTDTEGDQGDGEGARSVRLNGFSTCLRLEQIYWNILTEIAGINACSVSALLSYVDREVHLRYGGVKNFSGLVRVVCVVHVLKGRISALNPD